MMSTSEVFHIPVLPFPGGTFQAMGTGSGSGSNSGSSGSSSSCDEPIVAGTGLEFNYPNVLLVSDNDLVEITEEGTAIYAGKAYFLVTGSVNEDACYPVTLRIEAIRDGEIVSTGNHSLAPGQTIIQSVEVKILKANSITVISTILDPFTQEQLAQGQKTEITAENVLDLSPFSQFLTDVAPRKDIDDWMKSGIKSGISSALATQITNEMRDQYALEHNISRAQVDTNVASAIQGLADALEPQRKEAADKLFGVIKPLYEIRIGGNHPNKEILNQVFGNGIGNGIKDGLKKLWDPLVPVAEQLPQFLTYKPPSLGDLSENSASQIMSGDAGDFINELGKIQVAQEFGVKIPVDTFIANENMGGEFIIQVIKPTLGGNIQGWQYGGKLTFTKSTQQYDFTFSLEGKRTENSDGTGQDSFDAGASLTIEY